MNESAPPLPDRSAWKPYQPSDAMPWDIRRIVHLHRRIGFAANWSEIQQDLQSGPDIAIKKLLSDHSAADSARVRFEAISQAVRKAATESDSPNRIKAWWLFRMLASPDSLGERLTLMWHNHFATSNRKLQNLAVMCEQNQLFRQHAQGPFADLLLAVVKHPAILRWLDASTNRRGKPNENLARELMELFTLGVGRYHEDDVKEVARALTGWNVSEEQFRFIASVHDDGEKRVLGRSGRFNGDDVLRILLENPATAERLAWRICHTFLAEPTPDVALRKLAEGLRERNLDLGWAIETVVRSELFFSDEQIRNRVLGPTEFVVGGLRALELNTSGPNTMALADWVTRVGQDLFYPPNVGGWKEGRAWLNSNMIVARTNFAAALVEGELWIPAKAPDLSQLTKRYGVTSDLEESVAWFARLLWGEAEPLAIVEIVKAVHASKSSNPLSTSVALLLSSPNHYQS